MRVALILSGNRRSFKRTFLSLKDCVLDKLHPDIFIHTWDNVINDRPDVTVDGTVQEYVDLYKPKKYISESARHGWGHLANLYPLWESFSISNRLKREYENEQGFKYDLVIKARSDLRYIKPISYCNMMKDLSLYPDSMFVYSYKENDVCDIYFHSSSYTMDKVEIINQELSKLENYKNS